MPKVKRMLKPQLSGENKYWEVRAMSGDSAENTGELLIYGPIYFQSWFDDDVSPKAIKDEIDALGDIDTLYVRLNSPGGNVYAGNAIYNILRRVDAEVIVTIDGLAASAASVIAMAGDKVVAAKNSMFMIHDAWTVAVGNAKKLRKTAGLLDQLQKTYVAVYQEKTGLPKDEIIEMLDEETWLTAEEALEKGFVDEIDEAKEVAASLRDGKLIVNGQEFDASLFAVLPPFEGVANNEGNQTHRATNRRHPEESPGALRKAFGVVAKALGFDGIAPNTVINENLSSELSLTTSTSGTDDASNQNQEPNTKGSDDSMSDAKTTDQVTKTVEATEASSLDIENMSREEIMNLFAQLEDRTKAAEELARAERDKRLEAEFVQRVEGYGVLPIAPQALGPVMKEAHEKLSEEAFNQLEAVLRATGQALADSELFKPVGASGEGDSSPLGQYRDALNLVKEENPKLTDAEASLEAFKLLSPDVQQRVYELNVL